MARDASIKSVLVIGSGPIVIGQACEFDYSGTQACRVLRAEGIRVILVNSNPATIMTDPEFADATYIEPITPEFIEKIIAKERPDAVLATLGGQTALAHEAHEAARAVAALLDLAAVGVHDPVGEVGAAGRIARFDDQDLVGTDAESAVGQETVLRRAQGQGRAGGVEHNEVVAGAMHFGEGQLHAVDYPPPAPVLSAQGRGLRNATVDVLHHGPVGRGIDAAIALLQLGGGEELGQVAHIGQQVGVGLDLGHPGLQGLGLLHRDAPQAHARLVGRDVVETEATAAALG